MIIRHQEYYECETCQNRYSEKYEAEICELAHKLDLDNGKIQPIDEIRPGWFVKNPNITCNCHKCREGVQICLESAWLVISNNIQFLEKLTSVMSSSKEITLYDADDKEFEPPEDIEYEILYEI